MKEPQKRPRRASNMDPRGPRPKRNLKEALALHYPYSQRNLAKELGVSEGEVSKWISGRAHMPDQRVIEAAMVMGVNPLYLLDIAPTPTNTPPMDYDSYLATHPIAISNVREQIEQRLAHALSMPSGPDKDAEFNRIDGEYPGDYRDMIAFTQAMVEYLPMSPTAHERYVHGEILADYIADLACGIIGMTFAN